MRREKTPAGGGVEHADDEARAVDRDGHREREEADRLQLRAQQRPRLDRAMQQHLRLLGIEEKLPAGRGQVHADDEKGERMQQPRVDEKAARKTEREQADEREEAE